MNPGRYAKCFFILFYVVFFHSVSCVSECDEDYECPGKKACTDHKCADPCLERCGLGATCYTRNHVPICSCPPNSTGSPFKSCHPGVSGSRDPECDENYECPGKKACIDHKCADPCLGSCGLGATCYVRNHVPICSCPPEFTGDPFTSCHPVADPTPSPPEDLCEPSPCGQNAVCDVIDNKVVCECLPPFKGNPYINCSIPECVDNYECPSKKACIQGICADPCLGSCGLGATCYVRNHAAVCSCPPNYTGDPFISCRPDVSGSRDPESDENYECPGKKACIDHLGSCGLGATCYVRNHGPICSCPPEFTGDPLTSCRPADPTPSPPKDLCEPSPCGQNAVCGIMGKQVVCECPPSFKGNPYINCSIPECVDNYECPNKKACIDNKCADLCPGKCGVSATCTVVNDDTECSCPPGFEGDPLSSCRPRRAEIVFKAPRIPSKTKVTVRKEDGTWESKNVYSGDVIFEDDFSSGPQIDSKRWSHEVKMPLNNGYGFVVYQESPQNSFVKDNLLFIKPTLIDDQTARRGTRYLENCTGQYDTRECDRIAVAYEILPPVETALLTTKDTMSFKYGRIDIRAKLPMGDWIVPEIQLEPKYTRTYGKYNSGLIKLALARGNRHLLEENNDIGNNYLEMGFEIGGNPPRTVSNINPEGWGSGFHNFTLLWTPDNLKFQVDDIPAEALCPVGRKLYRALGIQIDPGKKAIWDRGSNIAPFDQEFYLTIGLSVGGLKDFPDGSRSGDKLVTKPWRDEEAKALLHFWENRGQWLESWGRNDGIGSSLQIDYVRITAI